jgi:hypothetical protein
VINSFDLSSYQGMNFVVGAVIVGRLHPNVTHMALAPHEVDSLATESQATNNEEEEGIKYKHVHLTGNIFTLSTHKHSHFAT